MKSNPYKSKKYRYHSRYESLTPKKRRRFLSGLFQRKDKSVYIDSYRKNIRAPWIIPSIIVLVILILVFWTGPILLNTVVTRYFHRDEDSGSVSPIYTTGDYEVVKEQIADVFFEPDLKSKRKTQLLYNDVVKVTGREYQGFLAVETSDGETGYVMSKNFTSYTDHVEPSVFSHKILITSKSKRIMSHSSSGSLLMEVLMGTVLFSDYQGSNVYRVALADDSYGWISASGMIRLDPDESPTESTASKFYETALSFNNNTYIEGGISKNGVSSAGIAFISGFVNGIDVPRNIQDQIYIGTTVDGVNNSESDGLNFELMEKGDLIFFGERTEDGYDIKESGIIIGYGQVLMSRKTSSSIKIVRLEDQPALSEHVIAVRRLFS